MNSPKNPDLANANIQLKKHLPLLIRWGVACLMVIVALVVLATKGEGEVNQGAAVAFYAVWLLCLFKSAQSGFVVVAALVDRSRAAKPD